MAATARAPSPSLISIAEIKDRLLARLDLVVAHYAPPANGSYQKGALYFTLNPGRADRTVGSFCIHMAGGKAGQWVDYAVSGTEGHGDVIDLIGLSLGLSDPTAKIKAAREWLGLDTEDPATRRSRDQHAAQLRAERERRAVVDEQARAKNRDRAYALWLSGQEAIIGTPVDAYLKGRGIDLSILSHPARAVRFHPECRYYFDTELVNDTTGEVTKGKAWRPMPAMLTAIARGPKIIDCHRIYLARRADGSWGKADLPDGKKVFTDYTGGCARLSGEAGPRGGHLRLAQAPQGARVYIAEGIENALSLVALRALSGKPPAFVVAAGSIWNMAHVELPAQIGEVVLLADNDQHDQARDGLRRAQKAHQDKGRTVRTWASPIAGEDINDALKRALQDQKGAA